MYIFAFTFTTVINSLFLLKKIAYMFFFISITFISILSLIFGEKLSILLSIMPALISILN